VCASGRCGCADVRMCERHRELSGTGWATFTRWRTILSMTRIATPMRSRRWTGLVASFSGTRRPDPVRCGRRNEDTGGKALRCSSPTASRSKPAKPRWVPLDLILRCGGDDPEVVQNLREISDRVVHPARQ
jgi:hypothetical protein